MQDELGKLLAQAIRNGTINFADITRTMFRELAQTSDLDIPNEDRIACVVAEGSHGVLSSSEDEAIARSVLDLFLPIIAAQRARIKELENELAKGKP